MSRPPFPPLTPSIPPLRNLTRTELRIVGLLADRGNYSNRDIAHAIGWKPKSVAIAIERIAEKIPGTLPPRVRVLLWARGADATVLHGMLVQTVAAPSAAHYAPPPAFASPAPAAP